MRDELIFQAPKEFAQAIELIPIKPLRHGTRTNQLVVMQSKKNSASLRMRPLLVDFCVELERRRDVLFYQTSPYRLKHSSRKIQYTPSVCAYGPAMGLVFFDIVRFADPVTEHRCALLKDWFGEMGYQFCSYTLAEHSCDGPPRQYRSLYHSSFGCQPACTKSLLELLRRRRVMSIEELLVSGAHFRDIAAILFSGHAHTDLRFPLQRSTPVYLTAHHDEQ